MAQRKDAAERRRHILHTAKSLFTEYGVDNVSMHQIAKSAGIGQGTLYRNYTNKADLCLDMIKESARQLQEDMESLLEQNRDASVRYKLEQVLFRLLDFIEEKSQWLGVMQLTACREGRTAYYRSPVYAALHERIRQLIAEAVERKECRSDLDPVFAADALLAVVDPDLYLLLRRVRNYTHESIKEHLKSIYLEPLFTAKG